ncbi:hypothetical protein AAVH_22714 [Aphelenchoides avenae]|nr:hypothetical protein AAVH_22714 [Aphelenchus avenae]
MVKLVSSCKNQSAFAAAAFKKLISECARADLDSKKSLRNDPVIVLGGNNAQILSVVLSATFVEAPTLPDLVPALRDIVVAAASPAGALRCLPTPDIRVFMQEFNMITVDLPNVFWLNDAERLDGARLAHSLGSNALIADFTTVTKKRRVPRRSARAALRFVRQLKPSFVPENVDLMDPPPQQPSTSSSSAHLHGVRDGGVKKTYRSNNSSRGAPNKPGGGRSRDQWNHNRGQGNNRGQGINRKGQGNRRH